MGRLMSMSHQKYRILAKTWNPNKTTPKVLEYTIGVNTYLTKKGPSQTAILYSVHPVYIVHQALDISNPQILVIYNCTFFCFSMYLDSKDKWKYLAHTAGKYFLLQDSITCILA